MHETTSAPRQPDARGALRKEWALSAALGIVLATIYLSNGREIGQYDTEPTTLVTLTLLRGEGPYLDRFRPFLRESDGRLSPFVAGSRGHVVSRYPLGAALVALPLVAPQMFVYDRLRPGWDRHPARAWGYAKLMAKRAAALLGALTGVLLYRLLRSLGTSHGALAGTIAAALGSDLWAVASQALWQHGPAALALTAALLLLHRPDPSRGRLFAAGFATGALVAFRAIDVIFALIVVAYVARYCPRRIGWFVPGLVVLGAALLTYNFFYFGALSGGQAALEAMHPKIHGVPGPWAGNLLEGAAGTLASPSRGLFVYSPWVAFAVLTAPIVWGRLRPWPLLRWVTIGLVPYFVLLSKYAVWWAGHSFGPRYWIDAIPLFAVLFAFGVEWAWARARPLAVLMGVAVVVAIGIQAIGAYCYPSSWNLAPADVDRHHERLWDWSDTELSRCLSETFK